MATVRRMPLTITLWDEGDVVGWSVACMESYDFDAFTTPVKLAEAVNAALDHWIDYDYATKGRR